MRRALIVGINHYTFGPLSGCINDAKDVSKLLATNEDGTPNFDCQLMTSNESNNSLEKINRYNLKKEIHKLFTNDADVALLYFSGHGGQNDFGGYLITQDAVQFDEGVAINEILIMANKSRVREIIVILDCCYSGGFGNDPMSSGKKTLLREGVTIITSSRDDQTSQERAGRGVFTEIICEALEGEAADILGNINVASIYHYADQVLSSWQQRPVFKSHASTMITIRNCQPRLHPDIIRQLPIHFEFENAQLKLSPEFLIGEQPYNPEKEIVFSTLQMYFSAGLVSPTEDVSLDKQMRDVAKESKSCKLTKLGEYYWKLAKKKRL